MDGLAPSDNVTESFFTGREVFVFLTGNRGVKTQPTPFTGFPPIRRPSSKSHGYSSWNSWNESLLNTTPLMRSAIFKMKASPRPIAPAGGVTISPANSAPLKCARSFVATRCSKLASATTITSAFGCSSMKARTASSNCERLGVTRPSVAKFEPSTTTRRRDARIGLIRVLA